MSNWTARGVAAGASQLCISRDETQRWESPISFVAGATVHLTSTQASRWRIGHGEGCQMGLLCVDLHRFDRLPHPRPLPPLRGGAGDAVGMVRGLLSTNGDLLEK